MEGFREYRLSPGSPAHHSRIGHYPGGAGHRSAGEGKDPY